jgi:hypothetical protein
VDKKGSGRTGLDREIFYIGRFDDTHATASEPTPQMVIFYWDFCGFLQRK